MNNFQEKPEKEINLIHCKKCQGLLVKNVEAQNMGGSLTFSVRCPHCRENCRVSVGIKNSPSVEIN